MGAILWRFKSSSPHQSKKSPMGSLYFGYLIGYDLCFSEVLEGYAVDEIGL